MFAVHLGPKIGIRAVGGAASAEGGALATLKPTIDCVFSSLGRSAEWRLRVL